MKHSGKARQAGLRLIVGTLAGLIALFAVGLIAMLLGPLTVALSISLFGLWVLFALFSLLFFRDPEPRVPQGPGLVVAPGHGKVDGIDEIEEPRFVGGRCKRISIFLSVLDVHVQNAPVAGRVTFLQHTEGQFLSALKAESATHNENVLIGIEAGDGVRIGVRLIAGLIARRIVPFVKTSDTIARGERISLIQFGSRVDLYLPLNARLEAKLGDRVKGGQTVIAQLS